MLCSFCHVLRLGLTQPGAFYRSGGSGGARPGDTGLPEQAAGGALGAFEPEGVVDAESLAERLEASRGRLEACIRGAAKDAVQHTLGLVKTHLPEADLDPVGDGIPEDCSDTEWEANHAAVLEIAELVVAEL